VSSNQILKNINSWQLFQQVNDLESWIYSISEANRTPAQSPRWWRQFSFKAAYGLSQADHLSPATLDRLAFDFSRNRNLLRRYWEFRVKGSRLILKSKLALKFCVFFSSWWSTHAKRMWR
jgi:hypothetical protein